MIKQEEITLNKRKFYYTYSDEGFYIIDNNNNKYINAYDIVRKDYKETDELINKDSESDNNAR